LFLSCSDAERHNPLDPKSPFYLDNGDISIQIMSYYSPALPIAGVSVQLDPGSHIGSSDAAGLALFNDVESGTYKVTAVKEGFAAVADSIIVRPGEFVEKQLQMDGLPVVQQFSISSSRIRRWFPQSDLLFLEVNASVSDPDGLNDISVVTFEIPELAFSDTMLITATPGQFVKIIPENLLPNRNLQTVIGRNSHIKASDRVGFSSMSQPTVLARVIETVPQTTSPQGLEIVDSGTAELIWKPVQLPFQFSFRAEVMRIDFGISTPVWKQENVPFNQISVTIDTELPDGSYTWTVAVVDEFDNSSRSKEASFQIIN
jgi:hypothetical protein